MSNNQEFLQLNWSQWLYLEFALTGYGAMWFATFALAFLTQSHIETGFCGILGFPLVGLIYSVIRTNIFQENMRKQNKEMKKLISELESLKQRQGP